MGVVQAAQSNVITHPRDLAEALSGRGSGTSAAGVEVTPDLALMVSAVSSAVSLIAESIAQLPVHVYRQRADGGKDAADDEPAARLLRERPNTFQTPFQFIELMSLWLLLWGNAYAVIVRVRGRPVELIPVHPDRVDVRMGDGYQRLYRIAEVGGEVREYAQGDVLHLMDRSMDGLKGMSRLHTGRDSIGLARVAERWGGQLFANGSRPSGLLVSPEKLTAEQMNRLRDSWRQAHGGENALGSPTVLDGGMEWTTIVMNNRDAQFTEHCGNSRSTSIARLVPRTGRHTCWAISTGRPTRTSLNRASTSFAIRQCPCALRRWETSLNASIMSSGDTSFQFVR